MQTIKIPLGGITHATSENAAADGDMSELINLRHKDGTIQPVYQPKLSESFTYFSQANGIYVHRNAAYAHLIGWNNSGVYWIATESGDNFEEIYPVKLLDGLITNIEHIGHLLILTNSEGLQRFIYRDSGYYKINIPEAALVIKTEKKLATETPPVANMGIIDSYIQTSIGAIQWEAGNTAENEAYTASLNDTIRGHIFKAKDTADTNGWLYGIRFLRYAVKLYDGNYVHHSVPILLLPPSGAKNGEMIIDRLISSEITPAIHALECYSLKVYWQEGITEELKGLISSVDIFISEEIQLGDYDNTKIKCKSVNGSAETMSIGIVEAPIYRFYDKGTFIEDLESSSMFYKIHSIEFDKLTTAGSLTIKPAKIREVLVTKELLTDDAYTHNLPIPGCSYVYNQKLHIGDLKTKLFNGFSPEFFSEQRSFVPPPIGGPTYDTNYGSVLIETKIRTAEGLKSVFTEEVSQDFVLAYLRTYIAYPDSRAESMTIWLNYFGVYFKKTFTLKAHKYLNLAFYYDPNFASIFLPEITQESQGSFTPLPAYEYSSNVMKASKTANPFYFAPENTYSADGKIIGIASVNESVSSGTAFGQNPLYLFTDRGIKIMEVGTGEVYYARMSDGPRDVLLNKKGLLSLENGIMFPSEKGLIFLSGIHSKCLSLSLRGHWADELPADAKVQTATKSSVAEMIDLHLGSYNEMNEGVLNIILDGVQYQVSLIPNDPDLYNKVKAAVSATWNTTFVYSPDDAIRFIRKNAITSSSAPDFSTTTGLTGSISIQDGQGSLDISFTDLYKHLTVFTFDEFFKTFLENCSIGYNHIEDEVLLLGRFTYQSPNDTPVCFALNLESGLWHKATYNITGFVPDFPKLYGFKNDASMQLYNFNESVEPLEALFITRSIKFGSTAFKTMQRCVLRGDIHAGVIDLNGNPSIFSKEDVWMGSKYNRLMIYGSQDSITWHFIGGIDKGGTMHDLGSKTYGVSCKYFRVVYAGNPFYGSRFDFLEFLITEKYAEKPR